MTCTPQRLERYCLLTAWAFAALLVGLLALRISFPWDSFIWSESPFMTNMMKLDRGLPPYTDPSDVNSYVYSPALEYLCFVTLSPFGVHLDIRYCRLVVVLIGLCSVSTLLWITRHVCEQVWQEPLARRRFFLLLPLLFLLVFKSITAESPHPDCVHLLHLSLTALLGMLALQRKSSTLAIVTILFAGLGIWVKQTAALAAPGAALGLCLAGTWGRSRNLLLLAIAGLTCALQVLLLFRLEYGRYYLLEVMSGQAILWQRLIDFVQTTLSHHFLLLYLLPLALIYLRREQRWRHSPALILWACLGAFEATPALLAFCKINGVWNNLGIINAYLFVLVAPFLLQPTVATATESSGLVRWFQPVTLALFVFILLPSRMPPLPSHYRYCRKLEKEITQDVHANKRILVPSGTMTLIHAGSPEVPRDRVHTFMEMHLAGKGADMGTIARLNSEYYDRIYLNCDWYSVEFWEALERHYRRVTILPAATRELGLLFGNQGFLCPVIIYDRKPAVSVTHSPGEGL